MSDQVKECLIDRGSSNWNLEEINNKVSGSFTFTTYGKSDWLTFSRSILQERSFARLHTASTLVSVSSRNCTSVGLVDLRVVCQNCTSSETKIASRCSRSYCNTKMSQN